MSILQCSLGGHQGHGGKERDGKADSGVLLPSTLVKHMGWVASHTRVNGPIGFVCWSV